MREIFQIKAFLKYWWRAKNEHGLHSPFLFSFYTDLLKAEKNYYCFSRLERRRRQLFLIDDSIHVEDFGAGSHKMKNNERRVKDIAKSSLKSPSVGRFLFSCIRDFGYQDVLELGTCLGISTSYMASVGKSVKVTTVEACPNTSKLASDTFSALSLDNIDLRNSTFDEVLPEIINSDQELDLVFIDGNHRGEATYKYFESLLPKMREGAMMIFDDIYWSEDMSDAWKKIVAHPDVNLSADLFELGIVFFRPKVEKQHFYLKHRFSNS